jgi:hypothetical protein
MVSDSVDETLSETMIDATLADSFPASDPPAWTLGRDRYRREPSKTNAKEESMMKQTLIFQNSNARLL